MFFRRKEKTSTELEVSEQKAIDGNAIEIAKAIERNSSKQKYHYKVLNQLLDFFVTSDNNLLLEIKNDKDGEVKEKILEKVDEQFYLREVPKEDREEIKDLFTKYLWGYYILDDLINDKEISDIRCLSYKNIRIKKNGKRSKADVSFVNNEEFRKFCELVAIKNEVSISDSSAQRTFMDNVSSDDFRLRITVTTGYLTAEGTPYLTIRKLPKKKYSLDDLVDKGMLTYEQKEKLKDVMKCGTGVGLVGKGGAGKTYLYGALLEEYPHDRAGIIVQENDELFAYNEEDGGHPDIMFEHVITNTGEGRIEYTLKDLLRMALVQDVDMIGVGECKGDEVADLAKASYTGAFAMLSVHGRSAEEGINKLIDYGVLATGYKPREFAKMLIGIQYFVYLEDFALKEMIELKGWNKEENYFNIERIF